MAKKISNTVRTRMTILIICIIVVGFGTLIGRLFYLQLIDGEQYRQQATNQQLREIEITAARGTIYDRNMNIIAKSATAWTVVISPVSIPVGKRELVADGLAEVLDISRDFVLECTKRNTAYAIVKKKIEFTLVEEVYAFADEHGITAIYCEEDNKRYYPYDNFASTLLGFTGDDSSGAYGLEAYYNSILSGTPGKVVSAKNAWGLDMPYKSEQMYEAQNGNSLVLTIDETVQHVLEKNLEIAVNEHNVGKRAVAIAYDIKSGQILGMATKGDFNPNEPLVIDDEVTREYIAQLTGDEYKSALGEAQFDQWRNKAISDPYEPGSVFKIITTAAALEEGALSLNDYFECTGEPINIEGAKISCWKRGGHGSQNVTQIMQNSCNPAFITVGQRLGIENFRKYFKAFGLMETTGIDLPGEATSIYHSDEIFRKVELASSSMGQTFKVTPIQLISAVSAAVGGGYLYEPYVVSGVIDGDGNVIETTEPLLKRQVVSEQTSQIVAQLCESVVVGGSGRLAQVPGYRIGGKTGTSEKLDQTNENANVLSFFGFAPADDPSIGVLVMLDEPAVDAYGSVIAAPVVGAILEEVLPYLGFEPSYTEEELALNNISVPNVVGELTHDAQSLIRNEYLKTRVIGTGTNVVKQVPEAGTKLERDATVILYTENEVLDVEVPDVTGLTASEANQILANAGLLMVLSGEDVEKFDCIAAGQSPAGGEVVPAGTKVTVEFTVRSE